MAKEILGPPGKSDVKTTPLPAGNGHNPDLTKVNAIQQRAATLQTAHTPSNRRGLSNEVIADLAREATENMGPISKWTSE